MTDNVNFSYSFQTGATAPAATSGPLVAFADCELIPIDQNMCLVINRQNGNQQVVSPALVEALQSCTTFRTLHAHAESLAASRPELQGDASVALQALEQLDQAGMLMRATDIAAKLATRERQAVAPTRVFIVTCDRPAAVARLLDSTLRGGGLTQHESMFLVDDSRSKENRAANRELVDNFNRQSASEFVYFGAEEQASLLSRLLSELPEHRDGIRFLIDADTWQGQKTFGRARNLCLLLSVGYRAIVMDDDILCEAVLPAIREDGLSFGGGTRAASFYSDDIQMRHAMAPAGFNPLTGHGEFLGQPLGYALAELHGGAVAADMLTDANATLAKVLNVDAPILVTQCGAWGDPGTGSAHWVLNLDSDSIRRLVAMPVGLEQALDNRRSWFGSTRLNLIKMPFMSQMTGLDNSALLPPYFPAFRCEDLLFGAMVETMHHRSTAMELPWAVPHLPLDGRTVSTREEPIAAKGSVALLAAKLTERVSYDDPADPVAQLSRLAAEARRMAGRSAENLLLDYRAELARSHSRQLLQLRQQWARAQDVGSQEWTDYVQRALDDVQQALVSAHTPQELENAPQDTDEIGTMDKVRTMATGFAAGLEAWEAIRTSCEASY